MKNTINNTVLIFSILMSFHTYAHKDIVVQTPKERDVEKSELIVSKDQATRQSRRFAELTALPKPNYSPTARELMAEAAADNKLIIVDQRASAVVVGEVAAEAKNMLVTYRLMDCVGLAIWDPDNKISALAHIDTRTELESLERIFRHFRSSSKENTVITLVSTYKTNLLLEIADIIKAEGFNVSYLDTHDVYMLVEYRQEQRRLKTIVDPDLLLGEGENFNSLRRLSTEDLMMKASGIGHAPLALAIDTRTGELLSAYSDPAAFSQAIERLHQHLCSENPPMMEEVRKFERDKYKRSKIRNKTIQVVAE